MFSLLYTLHTSRYAVLTACIAAPISWIAFFALSNIAPLPFLALTLGWGIGTLVVLGALTYVIGRFMGLPTEEMMMVVGVLSGIAALTAAVYVYPFSSLLLGWIGSVGSSLTLQVMAGYAVRRTA